MKKFGLLIIFLIISISCREEIIEPDNFVGRINDPVQLYDRNSYTFLLNAKRLTMNLTVNAYFNFSRIRFYITLIDYESGYANVSVQDISTTERFRYFIADEVSYHTEILDGYIPTTINIRTENFTGKISIEFRKTL